MGNLIRKFAAIGDCAPGNDDHNTEKEPFEELPDSSDDGEIITLDVGNSLESSKRTAINSVFLTLVYCMDPHPFLNSCDAFGPAAKILAVKKLSTIREQNCQLLTLIQMGDNERYEKFKKLLKISQQNNCWHLLELTEKGEDTTQLRETMVQKEREKCLEHSSWQGSARSETKSKHVSYNNSAVNRVFPTLVYDMNSDRTLDSFVVGNDSEVILYARKDNLATKRNRPALKIKSLRTSQVNCDLSSKNVTKSEVEGTTKLIQHMEEENRTKSMHLDLLKVLKKGLIRFYREHESTIPVSPIVEETDVELLDFYVPPPIVAFNKPHFFTIDKNMTMDEQDDRTRTVPISSFKDLFLQNGKVLYKNIYLTADAGMGKTSFAKLLATTWCQAHAPDNADLDQMFPAENLEAMKQFDFLFLLHLRYFPGEMFCDIDKMILAFVSKELSGWNNDEKSKQVLEKLFEERTSIVVVDGLDEWVHPKTCNWKQNDLPHRKVYKLRTVFTTTRRWKFSTLKLALRLIDRHVELSELDEKASDKLEFNAIEFLNKIRPSRRGKRNVDDFNEHVSSLDLGALRYIPYVKLQAICLWFDNRPIGDSKCQIYSNITELTLERGVQRLGPVPYKPSECFPLPPCMMNNENSKIYSLVLIKIGKLAFFTLLGKIRESAIVFDKKISLKYLTEEEFDFGLRVGFISQFQDKRYISERRFIVSFQHKSIQEFFAALYISSDWEGQDEKMMIIRDYFTTLSSVYEQSNMFTFLSTMNPEVYLSVFKELRTVFLSRKRKEKEQRALICFFIAREACSRCRNRETNQR